MSERVSHLTPVGLGFLLAIGIAAATGCKKDEPPPPLPSAAPAPTPTPTAALTLVPEVAAVPDAGEPDAGKKVGTGGGQSLKNCCAALASNAALAPEPNKGYLLAAAQVCSGAVAAGQGNAQILAMVRAALQGAGMPGSCK
jgi:hypothetical protein